MEDLFFELLQVAVGTRDNLSCVPTAEQWRQLFELSKKQALTAIAFHGLCRLKESNEDSCDFGGGIGIDEVTYLKWLGLLAKVAQKNKHLSEVCASLCKELAHDGLYSCILKGQSNLVNYPEALREFRTPGDIDVWCGLMDPEGIDIAVSDADGRGAHFEKYHGERGVIEWVLADYRIRDKKMPEVNYHHVDWEYKYKCDNFYHPEADGGISIVDDSLGIDWKIDAEKALLSEKDTKHVLLKDFDSPFDINVDLYPEFK